MAATTEQASPFLGGMACCGAASLGRDAGHAVYGDCAVVRRHAAMLWTGSDCVTESRCDRCLYPGECDLRRSRRCLIVAVGLKDVRVLASAAAWAYKVRPPRKPRRCIVRLYKEIKNDLETTRLDVGRVTTVHTVSGLASRHLWGRRRGRVRSNRMMRHRVPSNLASPATSPRRQPPQGYGR